MPDQLVGNASQGTLQTVCMEELARGRSVLPLQLSLTAKKSLAPTKLLAQSTR